MDLRNYELDLLGVKFRTRRKKHELSIDYERDFVIEEVYPYQVKAYSTCENGYKIYEAFSIGDLVTMGVLKKRRM